MGKSMSVEQEWLAHPLSGVELRAMRRLKRDQDPPSPFVFTSERVAPSRRRGGARWWRGWAPWLGLGFKAHPHMLQHAWWLSACQPGHRPAHPAGVISASHPRASGLAPGITSAFRDDYRQSLASGLKAATARSYHSGSFRGGYCHGLAADLVSVNGDDDAKRWTASEKLWNWIDAHPEFGIGRPYLDKDPAHVAPIDGKEYAAHRKPKSAMRLLAKRSHTLMNRRTATSGGAEQSVKN
jgi:hypothetical protein